MFKKLVSNLPFSPQLINQIGFYGNRLKHENATRKLALVFVVLTLVVQTFAFIAPPESSTAASSNDVVYGGLGTNDPKGALLAYFDQGGDFAGHTDIKQIFGYFGLTRDMLANTSLVTINSSDASLHSVGRNPHGAGDEVINASGATVYIRPLSVWGRGVNYRALAGHNAFGVPFWVMLDCGNIVVPYKPSDFPPPTPPTPPPPAPPKKPNPIPEKQVRNLSRKQGDKEFIDANRSTAKAGETLEYTISMRNAGDGTLADYVFQENLNDILEYADLIEKDGGTLTAGNLKWPKVDIAAGQTVKKTITVKVKDPVPATPTSKSDPQSYDLCMDNVFENKETRVCINIPPPPKIVEQTAQALPNTGVSANAIIGIGFAMVAVFFFLRNRQLIKEVGVLRRQYHQGENS